MQKTVASGMRNTTVSLDGAECAIKFSETYRCFEVLNESDGDVTVSIYPEKNAGDDGVLTVHAGTSATLAHMRTDIDTVYITGEGVVQIAAKNSGEAVFKLKSKGGVSSGETIALSYKLTDYNAFKGWFDENVKPHIEDIFDIEYVSPYNEPGDWLVWVPKNLELSAYLGGVQFYYVGASTYLNLQAYYSDAGAHSNVGCSTLYFKKINGVITFGNGGTPHYAYILNNPDIVMSAGYWLGGI